MHAQKDKTAGLTHVRLRPLARCIAALFLLTEVVATAAVVTNCNDSGTGSLRSVISKAASGDTIDMSGLTTSSPGCTESRISLHTGEIKITQKSLTIAGPGTSLVVTGKYYGDNISIEKARIFNHTGTGTLTLENFSIRYGDLTATGSADAYGGCICSKGTASLAYMNVSHCSAASSQQYAFGGAIYATSVRLVKSTVEENSATGGNGVGGGAFGGAIYVGKGSLYVKYSTISGNTTGGSYAGGNGVEGSPSSAYIRNTTISNNTTTSKSILTTGSGIGLVTDPDDRYTTLTLLNSTLSNNSGGAALYAQVVKASLYNSTIAFNDGSGVSITTKANLGAAILKSVILSNNQSANGPNDFYTSTNVVVSGSHDLVFASTSSLPDDTIIGKCPLLTPLRNDGGITSTLMPGSGSTAIDAGNNVYNTSGVDVDQRGLGYLRSSGPPDIGAYEVQQDNVIFNSDFEGCP